jgi:hypothetical protein
MNYVLVIIIWKDGIVSYFKVISLHSTIKTDENHEKSVRTVGNTADIWTEYLWIELFVFGVSI